MGNRLPTFIHAGAQRTGSTWTYNALKDHPEVFMPNKEPLSFFDCHFHKGIDWYKNYFNEVGDEKAIGDESPGYIKHPLAPKRVANTVPEAKIIFCLRNPIERAYSQWWTAENAWTKTNFERCLTRHSINDVFITPGYYDYHLSNWEKYFNKSQIKIKFFNDFKLDNLEYIQDIYEFIGVNKDYEPDVLNQRIQTNEKKIGPNPGLNIYKFGSRPIWKVGELTPKKFNMHIKNKILRPLYESIFEPNKEHFNVFLSVKKYKKGMEDEVRRELEEVYYQDIKKLEKRTNRNLDHWFKFRR